MNATGKVPYPLLLAHLSLQIHQALQSISLEETPTGKCSWQYWGSTELYLESNPRLHNSSFKCMSIYMQFYQFLLLHLRGYDPWGDSQSALHRAVGKPSRKDASGDHYSRACGRSPNSRAGRAQQAQSSTRSNLPGPQVSSLRPRHPCSCPAN